LRRRIVLQRGVSPSERHAVTPSGRGSSPHRFAVELRADLTSIGLAAPSSNRVPTARARPHPLESRNGWTRNRTTGALPLSASRDNIERAPGRTAAQAPTMFRPSPKTRSRGQGPLGRAKRVGRSVDDARFRQIAKRTPLLAHAPRAPRTAVVPNGVDVTTFDPRGRPVREPDDAPLLGRHRHTSRTQTRVALLRQRGDAILVFDPPQIRFVVVGRRPPGGSMLGRRSEHRRGRRRG